MLNQFLGSNVATRELLFMLLLNKEIHIRVLLKLQADSLKVLLIKIVKVVFPFIFRNQLRDKSIVP